MKFSWDLKKASLNFKKHKVTFEEASEVFFDPLAQLASDPDHSRSEDRMILIGHSSKLNLLFVVHLYKDETNVIRIISARKATKKEKTDYSTI
jgi:uncharacterized DUF497 family protein